jgi:hypothetical protein
MRNCRYWILDRNSRHPGLMEQMMQRMNVDLSAASRVDGGMAWCEARTKCIFCRCKSECVYWLGGLEDAGDPRKFCPNVEFFRHCVQGPSVA